MILRFRLYSGRTRINMTIADGRQDALECLLFMSQHYGMGNTREASLRDYHYKMVC